MFGTRKLKARIAQLEYALAVCEDDLKRERESLKTFYATYTLTESDLLKFKQQTARKKAAVGRMAAHIGYHLLKTYRPKEIVENGVVVGYTVTIKARRA